MTALSAPKSSPESYRDDVWHLHPGDEIAPGRTAVKLLGGGRRYEAYLAYDEALLTTVVVKMLRPSRVDDPAALAGMADEYENLQRINHPSISRGFDVVPSGPRPHIVLEHIDGPRLSTMIRRFRRLDLEQLVPLAVEVAAGLHYMHGRDLLHLDVKPQNIIMAAPPRLIDLSVASTLADAATLRTPVGTDAYMAPEQADPLSGVPIGAAADVWGLGVSLYEATSGSLPFPRGTDENRYPQLRLAPAPLPDRVPPALAAPIIASLARDPAQRPSAAELAHTLQDLVSPLPRRIVLGRVRPRWS